MSCGDTYAGMNNLSVQLYVYAANHRLLRQKAIKGQKTTGVTGQYSPVHDSKGYFLNSILILFWEIKQAAGVKG